MTGDAIELRPAGSEHRNRIETLLSENNLPTAGVAVTLEQLFVGYDGAKFVGVGGIEPLGAVGLLRSLAVPAEKRGQGYGHLLCDRLEDRARERGIETLYLLTTTAASFFERRGFEPIPRDAAPAAIRETHQFRSQCPDFATCMRKEL